MGVFSHWTETHETDYGIFLWSKWATSHYVLASFVFSTPSDLSFIAGKADSYVTNEAFVQFITWQIQQII